LKLPDLTAAWLKFQIRSGETALALRQAGHTWRQIADALRLADETHARRCAGLYLSADLASRQAAQDGAGRAQPKPAPDVSLDADRAAGDVG
jgi:hypothetical protein